MVVLAAGWRVAVRRQSTPRRGGGGRFTAAAAVRPGDDADSAGGAIPTPGIVVAPAAGVVTRAPQLSGQAGGVSVPGLGLGSDVIVVMVGLWGRWGCDDVTSG